MLLDKVPGDTALETRLRREVAGEVRFGAGDRGRYATDASIYQVEPVGVVIPARVDDVVATLAVCREAGVPVLARGGGTSQCGQTVNRAVVIDFSAHLRRVLHVDPVARTALVEPGIVLSVLNAQLKPHGLFFPVDPSTHARCTIGGMAGNNSCGSKSIRYGLMADNVTAIDAILADGSRHRFGEVPDNLGPDVPANIAELVGRLRALGAREADEIAARFPRQLRRVGGYNIDALTPAHAQPGGAIWPGCWSARRGPWHCRKACCSRCHRSSRAKCWASASSRIFAPPWMPRSTSCGSTPRQSSWSIAR